MATSAQWEDWLIPMFDGKPRLSKPPLIYWLQAASVRILAPASLDQRTLQSSEDRESELTHRAIWAYRLPSVVCALLTILLTGQLARSMYGDFCGILAGLLMGGSLVLIVDAHQARADQALLFLTLAAQSSLWNLWRHRSEPDPPQVSVVTFWVSLSLAILTKGPVTPAIAALTILTLSWLSRDWRWSLKLRPAWGVIILCLLIVPWLAAAASVVGAQTFVRIVNQEVFNRATVAQEGHWGPPGYYLLMLQIGLWPACLALVPAAAHLFTRGLRQPASRTLTEPGTSPTWLRRLGLVRAGRDAEVFLLAWWLPGWIVFELLATKLPHYTLPLYPAVAIICSRGLVAHRRWSRLLTHPWIRSAIVGWWLLGEVLCVGLPVFLAWWGWGDFSPSQKLMAAALIGLAQAILVFTVLQLRRRRMASAAMAGVAATIIMSACTFGLLLPHISALWTSVNAIRMMEQEAKGRRVPMAAIGYHEDSLEFLSQGLIDRIKLAQLPAWFEKHPDGVVLLAGADTDSVAGLKYLRQIRGFNYAKGKWVSAHIVALKSLADLNDAARQFGRWSP